MKKIAFRFLVLFGVMASLVFGVPNLVKTEGYASALVENTQASHYLIDELDPNEDGDNSDATAYLSTVEAGEVTGYGSYELNSKAEFTATANDGFELVGWQVSTYTTIEPPVAGSGEDKELTDKKIYTRSALVDGINYTITGNKLVIDKVKGDLAVRAVFDYVYYDVEIDGEIIDNIVKTTAEDPILTNVYVSYTKKETVNEGLIKYTDAIINNKYYAELFHNSEENFLYTEHDKQDGSGDKQIVEYSRGGYRYNENLEFKFDINIINGDVYSSKNLDVQSLSSSTTSLEAYNPSADPAQEEYYRIIKNADTYQRTSRVQILTKVIGNTKISWVAHKLYIVDFEFYNGENKFTDTTEQSYILNEVSAIDSSVYYSVIKKEGEYPISFFVKSEAEQGKKFEFNYPMVAKEEVEGQLYNYYDFESLMVNDADTYDRDGTYKFDVKRNSVVKFTYVPTEYNLTIKFNYIDENNGKIFKTLGDDYKITIERGEIFKVIKDLPVEPNVKENNAFYVAEHILDKDLYVGFNTLHITNSLPANADSLPATKVTTLENSLDLSKPTDLVVNVVFEKIKYTLNIIDKTNGIKLNDGANDISPIQTIYASKNGATSSYNRVDTTIVIENKFSLADNFQIKIDANAGFRVVLGYKNTAVDTEGNPLTFSDSTTISGSLTTEYLKQISDDQIYVYLFAEYIRYDFTYKVMNVNSANIWATLPKDYVMVAEDKTTKNVVDNNGTPEDESDDIITYLPVTVYDDNKTPDNTLDDIALYNVIELKNLKLYDVVTVYAEILEYSLGSGDYYIFKHFKDESNSINTGNETGRVYDASYQVLQAGKVITAVAIPPETTFEIKAENNAYLGAYTCAGYAEIVSDNLYTLELSGDELNPTVVSVSFNVFQIVEGQKSYAGLVKQGYYFNGVELKVLGQSTGTPVGSLNQASGLYSLSFDAVNSNGYELILKFNKIEYNLTLKLTGETGDLTDDDKIITKNISIDDASISFELPEGRYVKDAKFGETTIESLEQEYNPGNTAYKKDLVSSLDLFGRDHTNGKIAVEIELELDIARFDITINIESSNKIDSEDVYTNYEKFVTFTFGSFTPEQGENKYIFRNIPYGTRVEIIPSIAENRGLEHSDWVASADSEDVNKNSIIYNALTGEKLVTYKVKYINYVLNINEFGSGTVSTLVEDVENSYVTIFDKFEIKMQADKNNGYRFNAIYTEYIYNEDDWIVNALSYYILDVDKFVLNEDETYHDDITYYVMLETSFVEENASTTLDGTPITYKKVTYSFTDGAFGLINYVLDGKNVNFYVEFVIHDIKFNLIAHNGSQDGLNKEDLNVRSDDFANLNIKVDGADSYLGENTVNINNEVLTLFADMNNVSYDNETKKFIVDRNPADDTEQLVYNLSRGIYLSKVSINIRANSLLEHSNVVLEDNEYSIDLIKIESIIKYLPDYEDAVDITFTFKLREYTTLITTNIPGNNSFYNKIGPQNQYMFSLNAGNNAFGDARTNDSVTGVLTDKCQFMAYREYSYSLVGDYLKYFKINTFEVYYKNDESVFTKMERDDYSYYGVGYNPDNLKITMRFVHSEIKIVYIVEPIISFKEANGEFRREYKFDFEELVGIEQALTIGTTSDFDISMPELLYNALVSNADGQILKYNGVYASGVTDAGTYTISFAFKDSGEYGWLSKLALKTEVKLIINPIQLELTSVVEDNAYKKPYDGKSQIGFTHVSKYLRVKFGATTIDSDIFNFNCESADICDSEGAISSSVRDEIYCVKLSNVSFSVIAGFEGNFVLVQTGNDYVIENCAYITKKAIKIENIQFYDKVKDGNKTVCIKNRDDVRIVGVESADVENLYINWEELLFELADFEFGENKPVSIVKFEKCLDGPANINYSISKENIMVARNPDVYRYIIDTDVPGIGKIELVNDRALIDYTNEDLIKLIPFDATLEVRYIERNSVEYGEIYNTIEDYISGNREFAYGFAIAYNIGGELKPVPKELYLRLQIVDKMKDVVAITGNEAKSLNRVEDAKTSTFMVDLSEVDLNVDKIIITRYKVLFTWWQIALMVGGVTLFIALIAAIQVIRRKIKLKKYSINETI